ncbi:HIT domain-containing protein [Nocardiopsis sp. N85]|uniref:HIT family protein n=1 Tax=Nocardiopsis sp. N85 TaxID=3029400 RepID=UPI00237F9373|nr:HIT domain-containing protein [Nocardiopsis sp. N85]MDE3721379.1 HIT domain-containing protein [Nocardiopsis sp. N85]
MTISAQDQGCPFCAIAQQRAPAREVLRTEDVVAFLPDVPAVLGHTLLIPRQHARDIWDVDVRLGQALTNATRQVVAAVSAATGTRELNIIQSNGAAAGQSVFHLHVHVVPRRHGDRMPHLWPPDANWSPGALDVIAGELRSAFPGTEDS